MKGSVSAIAFQIDPSVVARPSDLLRWLRKTLLGACRLLLPSKVILSTEKFSTYKFQVTNTVLVLFSYCVPRCVSAMSLETILS